MDKEQLKLNDQCFSKALRKIDKARKLLCGSLPLLQDTPVLNNDDVSVISESIDFLDSSLCALTKSFKSKTRPEDWNETR